MSKPIEFFKDNEEFQKCAREWQHKLFLDDWFIKFKLVYSELYLDNEEETEVYGYCTRNFENHEALIKIAHKKNFKSTVARPIEELTLVHELLHCFIFPLEPKDGATYEQAYLGLAQHVKIDKLAKSFIMAKYNIDYNYFMR